MRHPVTAPLFFWSVLLSFVGASCESSPDAEPTHDTFTLAQAIDEDREAGRPWYAEDFPLDEGIPAPYIPGPVHVCARTVRVTGGLEGAEVWVLDAQDNRLNAGAVKMDGQGSASVALTREIEDGDVVRAVQVVDGNDSPPSSTRSASFFAGPMPRPIIDAEVHECTFRVRVKGVVSGAALTVENLSTGDEDLEWPSNPDSVYHAPWHRLTPRGSATQSLEARQVMCPQLDIEDSHRIPGPPSLCVAVLPRPNPVPPVTSLEHTVGADYFTVRGSVVGAHQDIHDQGTSTGWFFHPPWSDMHIRWDVEPSTRLSITQEMCGESSPPTDATVYPESHLDMLLEPPEILEPICPGATVIEARASMPGGKLGVLDANLDYLGAQATPDGTSLTRLALPSSVSLHAGDLIHVRHVLRTGLRRDAAARVVSQGVQLDVLGTQDAGGMPTLIASESAEGPSFRLAVCCEEQLSSDTIDLRVRRDDGLDFGTITLQRERAGLYEGRWDWLVPNVATPDGVWPPRENHTYQVELAQPLPCGRLDPLTFDVVTGPPVRSTPQSSPLLTHVVRLTAGETIELRANRRAGSGDPMMRVFTYDEDAANGVHSGVELARDDDSGGTVNALISSFTPPETMSYLIVVHDTGEAGAGGRAEVRINGKILVEDAPFGGTVMEVGRTSAGDRVETLFEPDGDLHHQMLVLGESIHGEAAYFGQHEDAPARKSVHYTYPGDTSQTQLLVFGSLNPTPRGMGAVLNRLAFGDTDDDGLADSLERRFGTCTRSEGLLANGWECDTYDSRDSDNDGLSDAEEVLGVQASDDDIPFRYWGAEPGRKDVFFEVDWDDTADRVNTDIMQLYTEIEIKKVQDFFLAGSDTELKNPNGKTGIALHHDMEGAFHLPYQNINGLTFDGGGSHLIPDGKQCMNAFETRRQENMTLTRQHYFRYICSKVGTASRSIIPSLGLELVPSPGSAAHESGHMLGLGHGGSNDTNGKPNYFSIMNYIFSDGWNYARPQLPDARFSHGLSPTLHPHDLCERDGLQSQSVAHLGMLPHPIRDTHKFLIDEARGWVDWNMDGQFSDCSSPVRGATTFIDTDTELYPFTQANQMLPNFFPLPDTTWSLARVPVNGMEQLMLFYTSSVSGKIFFKSAPFDGSCTGDVLDPQQDCLDWSSQARTTELVGTKASAARHVEADGTHSIYLVFVDAQDHLHIAQGTFQGSSANFVEEQYGTVSPVVGRPDILAHGSRVHVVWKTSNGHIMSTTKLSGGTWSVPALLLNSSQNAWTSTIAPTLAFNPSEGLHMLRTHPNHTLDLLRYDPLVGRWVDADARYDIPDGLRDSQHEAQMVWFQGFSSQPNGPGHWQLLYRTPSRAWRVATLGSVTDRSTWWSNRLTRLPVDLLYMPDHDNVVGVSGGQNQVSFLPFADGVLPEISDNNDFVSMSEGICFGYKESIMNDPRPCGPPGSPNALTLQNYYTGVCDGYEQP